MPRAAILEFNRYLSLERGLSARTVEAYTADAERFLAWAEQRRIDTSGAPKNVLDDFLWDERQRGLKAASLSRLVSALKSLKNSP